MWSRYRTISCFTLGQGSCARAVISPLHPQSPANPRKLRKEGLADGGLAPGVSMAARKPAALPSSLQTLHAADIG